MKFSSIWVGISFFLKSDKKGFFVSNLCVFLQIILRFLVSNLSLSNSSFRFWDRKVKSKMSFVLTGFFSGPLLGFVRLWALQGSERKEMFTSLRRVSSFAQNQIKPSDKFYCYAIFNKI